MATNEPITEGMAGRYAAALFELANEQSKLAEVESDLIKVQVLLDESADLRRLVRSPVFSAEEQGRALAAVLGRAGIGTLTENFFKLIARNRRLFASSDIIKAFRALAAKSRGEETAEVTSAVALNDAQLSALKDTLRGAIGKDVQLDARVDASLIGGLVVKIGSRMIDSSLRTKLDGLRVALKGTG